MKPQKRFTRENIFIVKKPIDLTMTVQRRMNRKEIAKGFADDVLKNFGDKIENIILFGSVARGESNEKSDIDILVVIKEEDFRMRRELIGMAFRVLLKTHNDISVKVLSKRDFDAAVNISFIRNIRSEGIPIGRNQSR